MPTFGSLFAGIGGLDLGFERAGWDVRWQAEIDPFALRVLARHWPGVTRYGDVRDIDWKAVERVDLVAGGFPCQPVSSAGPKLRQADHRWLWPEFARAVRDLRPRYVVMENVAGVLVGGGIDAVLGDLAGMGYDAEWSSLQATIVGAHHRRERVFLVAYADALADPYGGRYTGPGVPIHPCYPEADQAWQAAQPLDGRLVREWAPEPDVGRVADGVPDRVDRLRTLGNAVVPQLAELIAHAIMRDFERANRAS